MVQQNISYKRIFHKIEIEPLTRFCILKRTNKICRGREGILLLLSPSVTSDSLWPNGHTRLPCPSLSPRVCSNSCPLSWWCHCSQINILKREREAPLYLFYLHVLGLWQISLLESAFHLKRKFKAMNLAQESSHMWSATCFCTIHKPRMSFFFFPPF